ncbi:DUF305 domain-containing protein [Micromonospora purpureochromogenes]|uniref:DUF305 domain-containing protein n=1 Tax=Micromonospora purpureochromogenes TaxID=47872 RepID=UPI00331ADA21
MHVNRPIVRTAGVFVAAVAAVAFAGGCSGSGATETTAATATGSPTATADHNQADVTFAQNMIMHHRQAVQMAELAETRASDPQVKTLATRIKAAQAPEIQQMTTWLNQWGAPVPSPSPNGHGMHGGTPSASPGSASPGMMTDQDMAALENATGNEFDKMFLQMMISHHQGAVQEATTEIEQGQNRDAKSLAEKIKSDQTAEISQMQNLLKGK